MNQLGKFNGVLLVSDFDDTLYGEDMRITRENVEALTYFTREGGTFTVATGRARPNFAPHASHIPINAPVILSNGSALYDFRTGEMIYETFLPDRVREDLQQMARAIPTIGFEAYHHDAIYVYQPNAVTQRHLERAGMTAREVPIADIPLPWSKVILQQDYETLLHTQRYLLERWGEHYEVIFSNRVLLELTRKVAGNPDIDISQAVYESEKRTGSRNRALAFLLKSHGLIQDDVEEVLDCYFKACSILVNCKDLANIAFVFANRGRRPVSEERVFSSRYAHYVNAILMTCGMYNGAGDFAIKVGLPAKSGVGGGILSVVDRRMGIGIFGPALDGKGNSVAGERVLRHLSQQLHLHIFDTDSQTD